MLPINVFLEAQSENAIIKLMKKKWLLIAFVFLVIIFFIGGFFKNTHQNPLQTKDKKFIAYNLGVDFNDFEFTDADLSHYSNKIFLENGHTIYFQGKSHILPHPSYILPPGTEILAITDGKVRDIKWQEETEDYSLVIDAKDSNWTIDYDHVANIKVKKGQEIKANQIIAETAPNNGQLGNDNLSFVEIMVFMDRGPFGNIPTVCFYTLLDEGVKEKFHNRIYELVESWENYKNDTTIYDEKSWESPGCIVNEMLDPES